MLRLPTIKQLQYLVALREYRHFGRAAAASHVSQPAFSIAIRDLETLLGAQLADRTNRQVTFTRTGWGVADRAARILQELHGLVDDARLTRQPLSGQLRLGSIPTIAPFLFPGLLPQLRKKFPQLKLYLEEGLTAQIHAALMAGDLDLILIAQPYDLRNTESMKLFKDPFHLAFNSDTALLGKSENVSVAKLPAESILLLQDGHCLRNHALSACRIRNMGKISPVRASSLLTLIQMVDADLGVTYIPEMALGSYLMKNTRIRTLPLGAGAYREIALAWRRGSDRGDEFKTLGEFIGGQA